VRAGEAISVQVNHHPGWRALSAGRPVRVERDGIGLMWLQPDCDGECTVELRYNGGTELRLCRWVSGLTLFALAATLAWDLRPRRAGSGV
jgi:hypothetical protein